MVKERIDGENKKQRFERLAAIRTNKILEKIRVLGNCSNRGLYEYNDEQINMIFNAINRELKIARSKFSKSGEKKFSLK